jgi:hypothetical protein
LSAKTPYIFTPKKNSANNTPTVNAASISRESLIFIGAGKTTIGNMKRTMIGNILIQKSHLKVLILFSIEILGLFITAHPKYND